MANADARNKTALINIKTLNIMKQLRKSILLLLFASAALSLSSCHDGRDGLDGRPGKDGMDGVMNWDVWESVIKTNDWTLEKSTDNYHSYFIKDLPDSPLTAYIADSSNVIVYTKYENSKGQTVWSPLPATRHMTGTMKNVAGTADSTYNYSITYEYEFTEGVVSIIATRSDTITTVKPDNLNIRVVYNW